MKNQNYIKRILKIYQRLFEENQKQITKEPFILNCFRIPTDLKSLKNDFQLAKSKYVITDFLRTIHKVTLKLYSRCVQLKFLLKKRKNIFLGKLLPEHPLKNKKWNLVFKLKICLFDIEPDKHKDKNSRLPF